MAQPTVVSSANAGRLGKPVVMWPSLARTVATPTETSIPFGMPPHDAVEFELDVTAAATDTADTLNVEIYAVLGANSVEVCHFTEVLGDGGAKRFYAKILRSTAQTLFSNAAITAGNIRHILAARYTAKYAIVDGDADGSFTFSVIAVPL